MENSNSNSTWRTIGYISGGLAIFFPVVSLVTLYSLYKVANSSNQEAEQLKTELETAKAAYQPFIEAQTTAQSIIDNATSSANETINYANSESERVVNEANAYAQQTISQAQAQANSIVANANEKLAEADRTIQSNQRYLDKLKADIGKIKDERNSLEKISEQLEAEKLKLEKQKNAVKHAKLVYKNALIAIDQYFREKLPEENIAVIQKLNNELEQLYPTVSLSFHALEYADLRKEFKENQKIIQDITQAYTKRYTLKTYAAIYKLMVLALNAELQNIMYDLKFGVLEDSIAKVNAMLDKYIDIATEGNKTIAPTILAFIEEIRGHFIRAIEIEYDYYVKREKAREEQAALKEQMRQEAAERKLLEEQRKQVLKEESKFQTEINKIEEQLKESVDDKEMEKFKKRIAELEDQLAKVNEKKEEIINLQNGKAGYVYIISNLGSFGDNMFKIGMTRRIDPQDRINELGDASVPFKFDVHSFIFSEDAVSLESALHKRLEHQRVNKINLRKEFFYCTIDELEKLVLDIEPTAPFTRTMLAEQYRQSLEISNQHENVQ